MPERAAATSRLQNPAAVPPFLADLNPQQREAALTTEGPLLILAGAGSGKTKTLTARIAVLIVLRGVPAECILAVTFTNKAAREMRDRLTALLPRMSSARGQTHGLTVGTFHSFCARVLRQYGQSLGVPPNFTILDEDEAAAVMKSVIADAGMHPRETSPHAVLRTIGAWKDDLRSLADVRGETARAWDERVADLWEWYEARLREVNALDFDSLLTRCVALLETDAETSARLAARFRYLSVDEYQDTNRSQATLLTLLAGPEQNICVVGDDAQAIYTWRGARVENIRQFPDAYPGCRTITLEQNYRSTGAILAAANALIAESAEMLHKRLWTQNATGTPPRLLRAHDERDEGQRILRELRQLFARGYGPAAAAILTRTNAQSRALEEACLASGIPYEIIGGVTFYERKEVKDVIAYLRLVHNPQDALAFQRIANVPRRGVGARTIEHCLTEARARGTHPLDAAVQETLPGHRRGGLADLARILGTLRADAAHTPPTILLVELLKRLDLRRWLREEDTARDMRDASESRYENVLELKTVAERHGSLAAFLEELALMSDIEKTRARDTDRDRLKLMTIHAAKGLEFPIVVVAGLEEGLLPHLNALETPQGIEEERRLCYVAFTRAREHLLLSVARTRTIYGSLVETTPSRFLAVLPELQGTADNAGAQDTAWEEEPSIQLDAAPVFARGDAVRHATFGTGEVEEVDGALITVRFPDGVKMLDSTVAPLSRRASPPDHDA